MSLSVECHSFKEKISAMLASSKSGKELSIEFLVKLYFLQA